MSRLRTVVFWCHLVTGATVGLVVLVMSVTGALLAYQRQLTAWADARSLDVAPPPPGARRLPADSLLARVRAASAGVPTAVTWRSAPGAPVEVAFGRERTLFVDAYTGEVLGEGARSLRAFFRRVTELHRWLGTADEHRTLGRAFTGGANLAFLFLVLSGCFLWWPRRWTRAAFRNVTLFRRGLSGKARDFNWHHVIGLWSALPLAVVVLSGVVISYPWASDLVYRSVGEVPPPRAARPGGSGERGAAPSDAGGAHPTVDDRLLSRARARLAGWRSITLPLTGATDSALTFTLDRGTGGQPQARAQLTLERATGREVKWEPFGAGTPGRRLRSVLRFAHTGEVLGLPGQTVAGLVSLGAAVLVWTGLALAWRRFRAWRGRRAPAAAAAAAAADRQDGRAA